MTFEDSIKILSSFLILLAKFCGRFKFGNRAKKSIVEKRRRKVWEWEAAN